MEQYTQVGSSSKSTVETCTVSEEQELEQYTQVGSSSRSRSWNSTPRSKVEYRSRRGVHCTQVKDQVVGQYQGSTKRFRQSRLTNSGLVYEPKMRGEGG